jgi:hypothetical protein
MKSDGRGRFPCITKEERQVARVMLPDARVRVLAGKPVFKLGEFGVHGSLLFEEESITQVALSLRTEGEPNCFQFGSPFHDGSLLHYDEKVLMVTQSVNKFQSLLNMESK